MTYDKQNVINQANMACDACKAGWQSGMAPTWGFQQNIYRALLDFGSPTTMRSLLDVGCGQGDLLDYIVLNSLDYNYAGIDISDKMIAKAKERFPNDNFQNQDLMDHEFCYDCIVAAGLFNADLKDYQMQHVRTHMEKLFSLCRRAVSTFFLSKFVCKDAIEGLYYHDPIEIMKICMGISKSFIVDHKTLPGIILVKLYRS